ncbi:hypothetical protein B0H14DRAFT_2636136 [Mycena olivaceomarginata]|nr:hypothetical protein B0H14DRAFT_2636136 [Mycena olivaceomarginata]
MKSRTAFKQRQICLEQYGGTDCPACRRTRQMPMTSRAGHGGPSRTAKCQHWHVEWYNIRAKNHETKFYCLLASATRRRSRPGNLADFANVPITTEIFVKDRWAGLEPIHDADQAPAMLANVQDLAT